MDDNTNEKVISKPNQPVSLLHAAQTVVSTPTDRDCVCVKVKDVWLYWLILWLWWLEFVGKLTEVSETGRWFPNRSVCFDFRAQTKAAYLVGPTVCWQKTRRLQETITVNLCYWLPADSEQVRRYFTFSFPQVQVDVFKCLSEQQIKTPKMFDWMWQTSEETSDQSIDYCY